MPTERTTRAMVETSFGHFLKGIVTLGGDGLDFILDYNSAYGGYLVSKRLPDGGETCPFGYTRRRAQEMYYTLRFAARALAWVAR